MNIYRIKITNSDAEIQFVEFSASTIHNALKAAQYNYPDCDLEVYSTSQSAIDIDAQVDRVRLERAFPCEFGACKNDRG